MKKTILIATFLLSKTLLAQSLPGCELILTKTEYTPKSEIIKKLLKNGSFQELEGNLIGRLKAYETGNDSDLLIYRDINFALAKSPDLEGSVQKFISTNPRSYFSNLIAGIYYTNSGFEARGTGLASDTSQQKIDLMQQRFDKSKSFLTVALTINPKSSMPYAPMMNMAAASSGTDSAKIMLSESLRSDPKNVLVRSLAISKLTPRWGGSFKTIDEVIDAAKPSGLTESQIHYLRFSQLMELGSHFWVIEKQPAMAAMYYRKALEHCINSDRAVEGFIANAKSSNDWDAVIAVSTEIEKANFATRFVYTQRGIAFEKNNKLESAIKDYEQASKLGDAWSTGMLGYLYMIGKGVPKDILKARALLTTAASQGDESAKKQLDWLNSQSNKN